MSRAELSERERSRVDSAVVSTNQRNTDTVAVSFEYCTRGGVRVSLRSPQPSSSAFRPADCTARSAQSARRGSRLPRCASGRASRCGRRYARCQQYLTGDVLGGPRQSGPDRCVPTPITRRPVLRAPRRAAPPAPRTPNRSGSAAVGAVADRRPPAVHRRTPSPNPHKGFARKRVVRSHHRSRACSCG